MLLRRYHNPLEYVNKETLKEVIKEEIKANTKPIEQEVVELPIVEEVVTKSNEFDFNKRYKKAVLINEYDFEFIEDLGLFVKNNILYEHIGGILKEVNENDLIEDDIEVI